jgi:hypothetical protein
MIYNANELPKILIIKIILNLIKQKEMIMNRTNSGVKLFSHGRSFPYSINNKKKMKL